MKRFIILALLCLTCALPAATISNAFTATGNGTPVQFVQNNPPQTGNYSITGVFVATLNWQFSADGVNFTTLQTYTATQAATNFGQYGWYRWQCSAFTSGTATCNIVQNPKVFQQQYNSAGQLIFQLDDSGVTNGGTITTSGASSSTGPISTSDSTASTSTQTGSILQVGGSAATSTGIGQGSLYAGTSLNIGTAFTDTATQAFARFQQTLTDTQCRGLAVRPFYTPAATNANQSAGIAGTFTIDATAGALTVTSGAPNAAFRGQATVTAGSVTGLAGITVLMQNTGTGTIGDLMGSHVQAMTNSGGGTVTNTTGLRIEAQSVGANRYGVDIANISGGTTNFALRTQAGLVSLNDTTDATAIGAAALITTGGVSVAKRAFLGTIGSTFKGDVLAGVQDATAAVAGQVGEVLSATLSTYTNYTTTATNQQVTTLSITAGAWRVDWFGTISGNGATLTATSDALFALSTTTASTAGTTEGLGDLAHISQTFNTASGKQSADGFKIINVNTTTPYFLNSQSTFTVGNPQFVGSIVATRIR